MRIIENTNFKEQNYSYNLANRRFRGEDIGEFDSITHHSWDRQGIMDFSRWVDQGGNVGTGYKKQRKSIFDKAKDDYPYGMRSQKQLDDFGFNINNEEIINTNLNQQSNNEDEKINPSIINNIIPEIPNPHYQKLDDSSSSGSYFNIGNHQVKIKKKKIGKYKYFNPTLNGWQAEPLTEADYQGIDPNYKGEMPGTKHNATGNWTENEELNNIYETGWGETFKRWGKYGISTGIGLAAAWGRQRLNQELQDNIHRIFNIPPNNP